MREAIKTAARPKRKIALKKASASEIRSGLHVTKSDLSHARSVLRKVAKAKY